MKKRLDIFLVEKRLIENRTHAKAMIMAGKILINDQKIDKAGTLVAEDSDIRILGKETPFVSRGGLKLQKALELFKINLKGKIALDVGASTGGFTDCMLQNGALKVYAVDVGYGQLAWKLRQDKRVINLERTNIRNVTREKFEDELDFVTVDVAFISLEKVMPIISQLIKESGELVALIKPQFETERRCIGKKGVVKDKKIHQLVIEKVLITSETLGFEVCDLTFSPIKGFEGNIEYLVYLVKKCSPQEFNEKLICDVVRDAHEVLS